VKITFLVNHDLASLLALHYLIPSLREHQTTVFFSQKVSINTNEKLAKLAEFEALKIKAIAPNLGFNWFNAELLNHINTKDYSCFVATEPDLVISIRHMTILDSRVIKTPRLGVLNLHSGPLPAYQGVMATFWALFNRESHIGTTLHFIENKEIDTGSIVLKSITPANYRHSYLWNTLNVYQAGCQNLRLAIDCLENEKTLNSEPQSGPGRYYSFPDVEDITRCDIPLFSDSDDIGNFL